MQSLSVRYGSKSDMTRAHVTLGHRSLLVQRKIDWYARPGDDRGTVSEFGTELPATGRIDGALIQLPVAAALFHGGVDHCPIYANLGHDQNRALVMFSDCLGRIDRPGVRGSRGVRARVVHLLWRKAT